MNAIDRCASIGGNRRFELQRTIAEMNRKLDILRQLTDILGLESVPKMDVAGLLVDRLTDAQVEAQIASYAVQEVES